MNAELVDSIAALRERVAAARGAGFHVGLVPTMGALHAGHQRLIERARQECDWVVVSIFVNPLQFDRNEDLDRYPRTLDEDTRLCASLGVDAVFVPAVSEMYPRQPSCVVEVGRIASGLCGKHRPGHFRGVATVVMKLFQIVQPHRAYFGEKDAQQLAVIRHLVRDFNVPVHIEGVSTVRDSDGLALSSRNTGLDAEERQLAIWLYRALREAQRQISLGATDSQQVRDAAAAQVPSNRHLRLEYLDIVDLEEMQPVARIDGPVLAAGALWVGSTRLIDNLVCDPSAPQTPAEAPGVTQ